MSEPEPIDEVHLKLLRLLEANPQINQRELARDVGVSLGKVNYCLKALIGVGLIKVSNFTKSPNKKNYMYVLTPKGVRERVRLTLGFLEKKQRQYILLREEIEGLKRDLEQ